MVKLKKWNAQGTDTTDEKQDMIDGVMAELKSEPGSGYTVYVGHDTLIFGAIDDHGNIDIYETKIVAATQNHADFTDHARAAANSGGLLS